MSEIINIKVKCPVCDQEVNLEYQRGGRFHLVDHNYTIKGTFGSMPFPCDGNYLEYRIQIGRGQDKKIERYRKDREYVEQMTK